ncbi:thiol reductase thioredoxin [Tautonia sociabilis]|uniref:Thiol reductase thioredoxin n=1 Tax=Tautonia sociabilis TaxID=2080755 RepID=A0A432MR23_9BACT|nr:thiol reductase thioredoxin [Tautonia sociabilis]
MDWERAFDGALSYDDFLDRYGSEAERAKWRRVHDRVALTGPQRELIGGFVRRMPVLCLAGTWCGDCVTQGPILDHIARANPRSIGLRFLDRDALPELSDALRINGGRRVPTVVFLSEDFFEVCRFGDRTLSRYRALAASQLGLTCPTGLVPPAEAELATATAEWVEQFERAQLILRLSGRLREKHGD